jgi:glycosyltransferase involved in cell wall biosynthesis
VNVACVIPVSVDLVTPSFTPRVGGVETAVEQLADKLHHDGHDVTVLTHRPRQAQAPWPDKPYPVHRFREWTGTQRFEVAPGLWRHLRADARQSGLVHAHSFHGSAALLATATTRPLVFSPHFHGVGHTLLARAAHLPYDPLAGRVFDKAAAVLCVSQAEADLLADRYPQARSKTRVIPNGVSVEDIQAAEPYEGERVLLMMGRLETYKQIDLALRALALTEGPELVICGDGPQRNNLERLAHELGLAGRVRFTGFIPAAELYRWQRSAHVVLTLSRHEAFGLALAEAAAAGCHPIATDIPVHREVAGAIGCADRLVPVEASPAEVAAAIESAWAEPPAPPATAGILSWRDHAQQMVAVYRSVLAAAS